MHKGKTGGAPKPPGDLDRPIVRPSGLSTFLYAGKYHDDDVAMEAVFKAREEWVFRERWAKFLLFAGTINADLTNPREWFRTFLQLSEQFPKALKVVEPGAEKRPGAPRGARLKDAPSRWIELVREVDIRRAEAGALGKPTSIPKICRDLSKHGPRKSKSPWRKYEDTTLETHYHRCKAELEERRAKLAEGPSEYEKWLEAAAENAKQNNGLFPRLK
jgi:hypothetical protein